MADEQEALRRENRRLRAENRELRAYRLAPAHVDETIRVPLGSCPYCGGPVDERRQHEQFVTDVPPVRPYVRRYVTESGYCPRCRHRVRSRHPDQISLATGAAGAQLGPHVVAFAAALKHAFGVPYRKVRRRALCPLRGPGHRRGPGAG